MGEGETGDGGHDGVREAKGKVKQKLGFAAGDREMEAEGRVEQEGAEQPEGDAESVDEAEREVRQSYDELD
jgi:uncharacterized protein YjbJ (UPF0337 family)